jgi:hypothetical protein
MSFNASEFLQGEVSLQNVNALIKAELIELAKCLHVSVDAKAKKSVIKELVVSALVAAEYLAEDDLESLRESAQGDFEIAKMKLKLQERELELKYQADREHREFELKRLELETQKLQIEHGQHSGDLASRNFDVA